MEVMGGMTKAAREGKHGVLQPTLLQHYEEFLPNFERIDMRPALAPLSTHAGFDDSFWVQRRSRNHPGPP